MKSHPIPKFRPFWILSKRLGFSRLGNHPVIYEPPLWLNVYIGRAVDTMMIRSRIHYWMGGRCTHQSTFFARSHISVRYPKYSVIFSTINHAFAGKKISLFRACNSDSCVCLFLGLGKLFDFME